MSSTGDPVVRRTLFYERTYKDNREKYRFLPWYQVTIAGAETGRIFEPVDCFRRTLGNAIAGSKDIHRIEEFNGKAKLFQAEDYPDQMLHSFGSWDWPQA